VIALPALTEQENVKLPQPKYLKRMQTLISCTYTSMQDGGKKSHTLDKAQQWMGNRP
jgi:hypothetical protein